MASHYLLHGKLTAVAGQQEALAEILIEASQLLSKAKGCKLYAISKEASEPHAVYVTEIWDSKEDHDLSLKEEGVKALIIKAMPLLDGPPSKSQELEVMGGLGI